MMWKAFSVGVAGLLGYHGYKKKSLSLSGAVGACAVGGIHMWVKPSFGATLIGFYLSSSKLTKYRSDVKKRLEADYKEGGQRNIVQVLANSLTATLLALAVSRVAPEGLRGISAAQPLASALAVGFLGHYACCCADTWASELGILSTMQPRLVTNPWRKVPPGTNGGVTGLGLAASLGGGAFVGAVYTAAAWLEGTRGAGQAWLVPVGMAAGLVGSLLDSLLGATIQYSGVDTKSGKVVGAPGPGVEKVSGAALLDNHAVNAASSLLTAALAGGLAWRVVS